MVAERGSLDVSAGLRNRSEARVFVSLESSGPAAKPAPRFMESLSEGERRAVALESTSLRIRRGELVFRQGTNHDGIYIISSGRIRTFFVAPSGREIARGLVSYDAEEARQIAGRKSAEIEAILGYPGRAAMVHRDDMVMTAQIGSKSERQKKDASYA